MLPGWWKMVYFPAWVCNMPCVSTGGSGSNVSVVIFDNDCASALLDYNRMREFQCKRHLSIHHLADIRASIWTACIY